MVRRGVQGEEVQEDREEVPRPEERQLRGE